MTSVARMRAVVAVRMAGPKGAFSVFGLYGPPISACAGRSAALTSRPASATIHPQLATFDAYPPGDHSMHPTRLSALPRIGIAVLCVAANAADLPPTAMPLDHAGPRPKSRTAAEVEAVLAGAPTPPLPIRPLRIVLV